MISPISTSRIQASTPGYKPASHTAAKQTASASPRFGMVPGVSKLPTGAKLGLLAAGVVLAFPIAMTFLMGYGILKLIKFSKGGSSMLGGMKERVGQLSDQMPWPKKPASAPAEASPPQA